MKSYDVSRLPSSIVLGWDGENNWRPIAFDCSAFLTGHPDAVVTLWLLPKGEAQAFPVALERDGNTVIWTPLNEEMTAERGQLQIVVQDSTDVGKSKVVDYTVHDSLVGGADHPAEAPSWAVQVVADVTEQADRAEEAAESIGESIGEQLPGAIADYLEEHPVTVTETDPTVPAWAKNPQKPSYTAEDVGALPDSYTPPVTSVNGKTGAVTLSASDVHALPDDTVIPAAVTEQTVSGWGFTKNTGTYTKPSGGIPASDLASAVQTSLGKADTALQQHQSLSGYATEQWVENKGYLTQHQDITGKADKIPRIAKASTDTTAEIEPNKLYVWPEMASLTITLAAIADNTIVNEYHFCFGSGATATVLTLPASVLQPDGFTVEANMHYEISILEGAMTAQGWAVTA